MFRKLTWASFLFAGLAFAVAASAAKEEKGMDPGVHIDVTGVQNQCHDGINSVMLNNQSVTKYRIIVLKRRENDEKLIKVLAPHSWVWIGCADDGYSYSIEELVKL